MVVYHLVFIDFMNHIRAISGINGARWDAWSQASSIITFSGRGGLDSAAETMDDVSVD
jgi:hypothetical protein